MLMLDKLQQMRSIFSWTPNQKTTINMLVNSLQCI